MVDKLLEKQDIPGNESDGDDAPKDVRSSIRDAIKEVAEKEASDGEQTEEVDSETVEKPVRKSKDKEEESTDESQVPASTKKADGRDDRGTEDAPEKDERDAETDTGKDKSEPKIEPIGFWKAKSKHWDKASPELKKEILAREKEVSDGWAQVSPRLKQAQEIEQVMAPRAQAIQQFGVSPVQVVDRLFQWMEALGHPNASVKENSFKELAQSFGIDINRLASGIKAQGEITEEEALAQQNTVPEWFNQFQNQVSGEIGSIKQTFESQQRAAALNLVTNWAKDKPYFEQVRGLMSQLSRPGPNGEPAVVPLKDGQVDLDGAYEAAVKLHPEVAAQVQADAAQKAAKEAKDKAAKDAKERAAKLAKARNASVSLRPAAQSMAPLPSGQNLNGKKSNSVRDSIRAAIEETRG